MNISTQQRDVRRFLEISLDRWATSGYDPNQGTFIEALDFSGAPLSAVNRRGRVQTRQTFTFALAHVRGYDADGRYLRLAEEVSRRSRAIYAGEDGGWRYEADAAGRITGEARYAYEEAFLLMSLAALYQATGAPTYAEQAEDAWRWLETLRDKRYGGFQLGIPLKENAPRDQNPHMHLFEACMEAQSIDGERWFARAAELCQLCKRHFARPNGALVEFFTENWNPHPEKADELLPGHFFEWVWLLTQYQKRDDRQIPEITRLYDTGMAWGLDSQGLGVDEVRPGGEIVHGTKRLWVQCEVLKAHLARYETTRDALCLERAQNTLHLMFSYYLLMDTGIWHDRLNEQNQNISENSPASTFYHLFVALHEFLRVTNA